MKKLSLAKLQKSLLIILSILFFASMCGALIFMRSVDAYGATVEHPLSRYLYYSELTNVNGVDGYIITGFEYHETDGKEFGTESDPAVIPAQFNGYPIIGIADGVFGGANSIKHITFNRITDADGGGTLAYEGEDLEERALAFSRMPAECQAIGTAVREFGHNVFAASDIETITLPGSLAEQGDGTFFNCTSLRWVGSFDTATGAAVKDMSLLPYLKNFGSKCFMFDANMKDVVLPDYTLNEGITQYYPEGKGLVEIGDTCFNETTCKTQTISGTKYFVIPASATKMVEDPFDGMKFDSGTATADKKVYVKGDTGAYEDYPWGFERSQISWHGSNTKDNGTFYYNTQTKILGPLVSGVGGTITVPISAEGVDQFVGLAPGTFAKVTSSTTITFNEGWEGVLKELPSSCFKSSSGITRIRELPDSIEKIGTMAFWSCSNLTRVGTTSHDKANTINIPSSCTTIGFWAFKSTAETTVNIWASASASEFLVSQAAFVGNTNLTSVNFKNLTSGTPRQIGNLKERPEEESIWNEKTFPFGALANANCNITYSSNGGSTSTSEPATVSCTASGVNGTWRCIVLSDDDGNKTTDVQIVRTSGITTTGTLTIPSQLSSNGTTYKVVKVGNPNGNNDTRTLGSVALSKLIIPEGVKEIGYMVCSGRIGNSEDATNENAVNLDLPSTLTKIDDWAFSFVTIYTALHLPYNLQYIGLRTFQSNGTVHISNKTLVMPAYLSYIHVSAFANAVAPNLTDIYYMQYRTRASDKTFSRPDGKYLQFSGKNSSSSAGSAGIKKTTGGASPTVHYMDDYTPYVYEIGADSTKLADTLRDDYLPVVSHATDKGNHAYDMPTDNPVFATPKEQKDPVLGTVSGYVADIRFGVRMMTQKNIIDSVVMQNGGKISKTVPQDTTLGNNTVKDTENFFLVFLDDVVPQGDYVFKIGYKDEALRAAVNENGLDLYSDTNATYNTYFSVHIDIYASVKFDHALTQSIGGVMPQNMSEDEEGRALLKSKNRKYTEATDTGAGFSSPSEVKASDGDGIISTLRLPQPTFNHPAAEFIGWTTDRSVGGQVWIGEPAADDYTAIGEDFKVALDQLDENDQITVYSVFRLKLNKTSSYSWQYGDQPDGDFYQPTDSVAEGIFTMFRQGSDNKWRAEQVVEVTAGQLAVAFNGNFNNETHAGAWRVLQGDQKAAWEAAAAKGTSFEDFCNGLYAKEEDGSYDISDFTVDKRTISPEVRATVTEPYGSHIYGEYSGPYKEGNTSIEEYLYGRDSYGSFITINLPGSQTNQDAFTITLSGGDPSEPAPHVGTELTYTVTVKKDAANGIEDYVITGGPKTGKYSVTARSLALDIGLVRDMEDDSPAQTLTATVEGGVNTYAWTYYGKVGYESITVTPSTMQPANGGFVFGENASAAFGTYVPDFNSKEVKAGSYSIYVQLTSVSDSHLNNDYNITLINSTAPSGGKTKDGYLAAKVTINKLQITSPTFKEMYFGTKITADTLQSYVATHATVVVPEGTNELPKKYWDTARINQLLGRDDAAEDTVAPTIYTMGDPVEGGAHHATKAEGLADPENYWYAGTYVAPFTFTDATNYAWADTSSVDRTENSKLNANFVINKAVLLLTTDQNRVVYYNGKNYYDTFGQPGEQREKGLVHVTIYHEQGSEAALQIWGGQGSGPSSNSWSTRVFNINGVGTMSLISAGTYTYHFELQGDGRTNFVIFGTPTATAPESSPADQSEWKNITEISAEIDYIIKKAQFKLELKDGDLPTDAVYYDGTDKAAELFAAHFKLTNIHESESEGKYAYDVPAYNADRNTHGYRVTYLRSSSGAVEGATTAVDAGFYTLIVQLRGVNATDNIEFINGEHYTLAQDATQITWNGQFGDGNVTMDGYDGTAPNGTVLAIKPAEISVTVESESRYFQNVAYNVADIVKLASNGNGKIDNLTPSDYTITLTAFKPIKEDYTSDTAYPDVLSLLHAGTYGFSVELNNGTNANTTNNFRFVASGGVYTVDSDTNTADKITSAAKEDGKLQIAIEPAAVKGLTIGTLNTREYTGSETSLNLIVALTYGDYNPHVLPAASDANGYGWMISVDGALAQKSSDVHIKDVGKYTITIGLNGSAANDFVTNDWSLVYEITKASISVIDPENAVYNGKEQDPTVGVRTFATVTAGVDGDYTLTYAIVGSTNAQLGDNQKPLNAGTYTVTFTLTEQGRKNLSITGAVDASTKSLTFVITPALLNIDTGENSYDYDGQPHKKVYGREGDFITFSNNANEGVLPLESGFELGYQYNGWANGNRYADTDVFINVGTYSVTVTLSDKNYLFAVGNRNTYTFTYTIEAVTLGLDDEKTELKFIDGVKREGKTLSATIDGIFQYKIVEWTPLKEVVYTLNRAPHTLEDNEYTVAYSGNTTVGTATVTVRGINNYAGTIDLTFEITRKSLGDVEEVEGDTRTDSQWGTTGEPSDKITVADVNGWTYSATPHSVSPTVTYASDRSAQLVPERDMNITFWQKQTDGNWKKLDNGSITNAGTYRVLIEGTGNYDDALYREFIVTAAKVVLKPDRELTFSYDCNAHQVGVTFSGSVIPSGGDYELNYTYSSDYFKVFNNEYVNAGRYTLEVRLLNGNFAWDSEHTNWTNVYPAAKNSAPADETTGLFHYTADSEHVTIKFEITKAKVTVSGLDDVVFNRQVQLPTITFRNSANGTVLPVLGEDWGYWFEPTNKWQKINMAFATPEKHFTGIPSYADEYNAHIVLLGDARGNFEIEGATGGNVEKTVSVITGYPIKDGKVDNETLSGGHSEGLKYEKQVTPEDELKAGMHYEATFTVSRLDILLRHTMPNVTYDYDFSDTESDKGKELARQGRHTNDAIAIVFTNLKGDASVSDVPYRLYVYRMDTEGYYLKADGNRYSESGRDKGKAAAMAAGPFLVFHYTVGMETGNFVHFGPCTPECDSSMGDTASHKHIHFTYEADGKVRYTEDALSAHSKDIQKLREAFTNAGKFDLYVVLDNCSYKIQGGETPLEDFKPACYQESCACEIMEQFSFEIAQATLTPYLFDSVHGSEPNTDTYKLEGTALQIPYDGAQHYLWVWFTNTVVNKAFPDNRVPVSDPSALTNANYYAQYSFSGWSGSADTSAGVSDASDGYKNVGEYTVHISLKKTGNFRLSSGGYETTIVYNINAQQLDITDEQVTFEFIEDSESKVAQLDRASAKINGTFTYIAKNWLPVAKVLYKGTALTPFEGGKGDYTLAYSNNLVASDRATVTITGANNYRGTITLTFTISPKSLGTSNYGDERIEGNDKEIFESQLTKQSFVYTGTQLSYATTFNYGPQGASESETEKLVSMTMGGDYNRQLYRKNGGGWESLSQVRDAGTYRLVVTGVGNYTGTYVIEFTVAKAKVKVLDPSHLTFNRAEQTPTLAFENVDAGNSVVPTKSGRDEYSIAYSPVADTNAKLGDTSLPFNAGTYEVTITLNSTNFQFVDGATTETVQFVIDQLGVYAVQMMTEAYYNGKSYFYGDIYGSTAEKRYGGEGPWTFNFSSLTATDVSGIGYTITFTGTGKDGTSHTVVVTLGGYAMGHSETLLADSFTLDGAPSDWEAISALGLFTNVNWKDGVKAYTFTVGFADGNYKLERGSEFGFTVLPAILTLDNIESKVYNAQEQTPEIKFSLLYPDDSLSVEKANSELTGKFTLKYRVNGSEVAFGDSKPVDVNKYDVEVTVTNHNYAFDRNGTAVSTQTFDITPLDIEKVTDFEVTIPNKVYTGDAVTSEITQVVVTIGGKVITFKQGAHADNEVELSEEWFRIIGYNNNTNAGKANVTISAGKNFTGSKQVLGAFEIVARNIVVKIEDKHTAYGQSLEISNVENVGWSLVDPNDYGEYSVDWNWKDDWEELASSPKHYIVYKNDSLGIDLVIKDGHYNTEGGSLLVGTYAIVNNEGVHLASVNENYKIKFVGSWKGAANNGEAGTYTVTPREIVITPKDVTKQYGDITKANLAEIIKTFLWEASYTNSTYTGEAILEADRDLFGAGISLNIITANSDWSKGTTSNLNGGRYAIAVVYDKDATKSTYHGGDSGEFLIGDQYKITLGGSFAGEGSYSEDSAFRGTEYAAHAGTLELTSRSIVITIHSVKHEYNGQEPDADKLTWDLKDGSNLAAGDEKDILGVKLKKDPGVEVGFYSVNGAYTTTGSYIVTFEEGVNAVEITRRKVTVTLEPQSSVYGDGETVLSDETVWSAALSSESTYKGVDAIVGGDDLQIKITKDLGADVGKYNLVASYTNNNYDVTFVGESEGYEITKRNIIIKIDDITNFVYGVSIEVSSVQDVIWHVADVDAYGDGTLAQNWKEGTAQYRNDNLGILLKLATKESDFTDAAKTSVLKVGSYAIIVDGSGLNDNYNFYFQGSWKGEGEYSGDAHMSGEYKSHAGTCTVGKREIVITPNDASSDYGDKKLDAINKEISAQAAWSATSDYAGSAILADDLDELAQCISFSLAVAEGDVRKTSGYLGAGSYAMVGKFDTVHDTGRICDNYTVSFGGSWKGEDANSGKAGTYTVNRRSITVTVNHVMTFEYDGIDHTDDILAFGATYAGEKWTAENVFSVELVAGDTIDLLGISLVKDSGTSVGFWSVTADAKGKDGVLDYNVSFDGTTQAVEITPRKIVVHIHDQHAVYGEAETVNQKMGSGPDDEAWHVTFANDSVYTAGDVIATGDNLNLVLTKVYGAAVNEEGYAIYGAYINTNYSVTYEGSFKGEGQYSDNAHTPFNGHAGIYTITVRKLTVHVNDQGGVFGGRTYTNLSSIQGEDEHNGGWYIIGFTETKGISQHNQDIKNYVIPGDSLKIVLKLNNDTSSEDYAGKCAISAVCNNPNYDVKFEGSWAEEDEHNGTAGTFTVQKRRVTVTLRNQSVTYDGATHNANEFSSKNSGWTERVTNDDDNNTVTFVVPAELGGGRKSAPTIAIDLSMDGAKNVGSYAIHIVITRDEVVIFDSHTTQIGDTVTRNEDGSVVISTNEYEITVVGTKVREKVGGETDVKVCSNYEITPKAVTLTIDNKISTYGETLSALTWQDLAKGIVSADLAAVKAAITLAIEGREANLRGETYLVAGTYDIKATVASDETTKNYTFSFVGTTGTSDHGIYTVNKRNIGLRVNSASVTYGETPDFGYTVVSLGGITGKVILACDQEAFDAVIKYDILQQKLSSSDHLKAGEYPVWMSLDSGNASYTIVDDNYDITFTGLWNGGGTYTDGRTALNSRAGVLTVGKKNIAVTNITSASNPALTSEYGDAVPDDWSYTAAEGSVLDGDTVTVVYRTEASARANVGTYPVTVALAASAGDNDNYTMTMNGAVNYVITKRIVTVDIPEAKTIIYGNAREYPEVVVTRKSDKGEWSKYFDGESIPNVSISCTVVGETLSSSGFLRVKLESGAVIGYDITVSLSGDNANNYQIDGNKTFEKKLIVNKRPVTVNIDDKSSVYGESEQALTYSVDDLAHGDEASILNITLTRQGLSSGQSNVGSYAITGTSNCTDYEVTFRGNWNSDDAMYRSYKEHAGVYTITERAVRIEIYNQSAPYGETITVGSVEGTNWRPLEGAEVDGVKYYSVKLGDSLGIKLVLKKLSEVDGHLTRGAYELTLDESSVNANYKVTVVRETLPDGDEANRLFPDDFSRSETSIGAMMWGYGTPISTELRWKTHGMFFVTIREVDVFINDQSGVYGENYTLHQYEGNNAYTISLTKDTGTSGAVFIDGLNVTFDLVTTAYEGAGDAGLKVGKLTYAGYYPIFSSGITATKNGEPLEDQAILQNYRFNFTGGWSHGGTYPSGSPYNERVGVFTVQKRNVTVTVSDVSTTYGTYRDLNAEGGELLLANQKGYTAIVNNGTGSAFVTEADEALFNIALKVRYSADQVSTGRALNAGSYNITPSKLAALEGNAAFNSYDVTFASTAPKLEVAKANITISILGGKSSVYGDTLREEDVIWNSKAHPEMFNATVSGGYVEGDVLDFDMYASLIDDVTAHRFAKAGNYAIYVPTWSIERADNANYNMPTWTGSFTGGVRSEDAHYANVAGIYTVRKKPIEVTINDAQSEYGEEIDNSKFSYALPEGWSVGDDTEDDLHIVLSTDANESSPFSATGYAIKGYSSSANYEVTFKGSYLDSTSGTLTVDPRRIVVVILPQDSVYGTNPVANSETTWWFVVRDGSMVNARNMAANWASVFGAAREKTMGELLIALTKGITYVDGHEWSNGNGLFVGDYAITGRCDNSNFDVVFCGYNDTYDGSFEKYYPTVSGTTEKEKAEAWGKVADEWGVYTITPLSVTVQIKDRTAVYGSTLTDGVTQLRYNAKLVNTQSIAWMYGKGSGTFTVGHEQYLDFYLRCAAEKGERGDIFAEVGAHEIEGVWAETIVEGDTDLYGIKLNYDVKFVNEKGVNARGVFTVTPAAIQQNNREAVDREAFTGTLWNQTQLYRGESGGYSLKVDERFFIFAGDLKFGEDRLNGGSVIYDAATVTYNNLKRDNQSVITGAVSEDKLEITTFGVWTVEVTIAKENHETVTFTLSLTVVQADLTVTLKPEARFTATYGDYLANGQGAKSGAKTFEELKQALKKWLFDTAVIEKIDGAENIASSLQAVINALLRVEGDDAITVSIITTDDNVSTGGYLNAGNYVLTFEVDGNIKIKFAQTYSVVTIAKRALEMQWTPAEGEKPDVEGTTFTYKYDGEDHKVVAMPTDLLEGDLVANFGMTRYLVREGTEEVQLEMRLVGEYRVRVLVDINSASEGNHDIGNYEVRSIELTVFIKTISITVLIKDRTNEYGETELDANAADTWEIIGGKETLPEGEDLLITLSFETFSGSERRPSGKYKIFGRSDNANYTVEFVGSYGESAAGRNDGDFGTYTVTKRKIVVNAHDIFATYGDYTSDDLADYNFVTLGDRAYSTSRPDGPVGYSAMAQTSTVTIFPDDMETLAPSIRLDPENAQYTDTRYLKANEAGYRLICSYNRDFNYDITFVLDSGAQYNGADSTSKLIVSKKDLSVTIYTRTAVYGDDRPTMPMNYSVSGFASEDTAWFEINRDTAASFLKFTVRNADTTEELDESKSFDPVGVYIIMLESDTSESHDIGSNYNITVTGEWTAYGRYTSDIYVGKASRYEVTPRSITIVLRSASGEYGDANVAERFTVEIISTLFAPDDTAESIRSMITLDTSDVFESGRTKAAGASYDVTAKMSSRNYTLDGTLTAKYQVVPRQIDLRALDLSSQYGDRHKELVADSGYSIGWDAVRSNGMAGDGIAYPTDAIRDLIRVATDTANTAEVGTYRIYIDASTINADKNYHVNNIIDSTLTVERRKIKIRVNPQSSEYGEVHLLSDKYGEDWTAERAEPTKYSDESVVVLPSDIYDIVLRFAIALDRTSPAGPYEFAAQFNNRNYVVDEVEGVYTITPRKISVRIEDGTGEYGDPVSGLRWTASRVGGNAIVNGDELNITLNAVLPNGKPVDTTIGIGTYPIIVTAQNNPNYEITFTGDYEGALPDVRIGDAAGNYVMTPRRIIMTFNGESEYGDLVDPKGASYRADGKEGPAIVNGDDFGYEFEWVDDPYADENLSDGYPAVGSYRLQVRKPTAPTPEQANYEVVSDDVELSSVYRVVPRKVTVRVKDGGRTYGDAFVDPNTDIMGNLDITRTTHGKSGEPILHEDIKFFSLTVIDGDVAQLTDGIPYFVGTYNYDLTYTLDNSNYELQVVYGNYVVSPKPITVHIDDKTQNYGEDLLELTHGAIEGVLEGDDLGFALSVQWGEGQEGLTWHNAGVYRIEASAANPNYALVIDGTLDDAGAYTILKVRNSWLREYAVERLQQGDEPDPELLPEAEWGDVIIKYYLDEACTQELDRDIRDADRGTYYVKVTVLDTINWDGLESDYIIEIFNDFLNIDGTDITAYVCLFAAQFPIGLFALLFVGRKKKQKK